MKHSQYRILEDSIAFDFYEFRFSSLRKNNILTLNRIQEVDFNTFPYSMEIDEGEIIFFNHDDKERIKDFAQKHHLPLAYKPDVWEMLCAPVLDTELNEAQIRQYREKLQELHFSSTAIKQIRKKVKSTQKYFFLGGRHEKLNPLFWVLGNGSTWASGICWQRNKPVAWCIV